ncbi:MAG: intermembrane transport protein PqiB [Luteolibacter sp.]
MEATPDPDLAPTPTFHAAQRWNAVWVVPIIALLVGIWMIWQHVRSHGPVANVSFETADGIVAGKTEVRCRSVRVGFVKSVDLSHDLNSVTVRLQMDPETRQLLTEGSRFWVVRPRVSGTDISGLGTLLTGAYIELDPGTGPEGSLDFVGLEVPPATISSIPGLRLRLNADQAASLVAGSPVYYRGFEIGRIEGKTLDPEGRRVVYNAFIREEYSGLIRRNTRFWNTSGIDVTAGVDGFKVRTPSFQAMFTGGVSCAVPGELEPGELASDGSAFRLYPGENEAMNTPFDPNLRMLLLFDHSVRGLKPGAPVEFRGMPIGRVADISFQYLKGGGDMRVPVLVEIDTRLLLVDRTDRSDEADEKYLEDAVTEGLRASLKTASLITGALYVDLDYYADAAPMKIAKIGDYPVMPTISSGLAQLESKLTSILEKIDGLPLDEMVAKFNIAADETATTVAEAREVFQEIQAASAVLRATLEKPSFQELPDDLARTMEKLQTSIASLGPDGAVQGDLLRTLDEMRAALRSMTTLTNSLDEKPNSLIFGRESSGNPVPRAPR